MIELLAMIRSAIRTGSPPVLRAGSLSTVLRWASGVFRYAHQYRVRTSGGAYRWVEANGRVSRQNGDACSFAGVLLDVSDRRALAEERDRARRLLETFVEAVPGNVYAKDLEGRVLVLNRGVAELVGKPASEILGRHDLEFLDDEAEARAMMATDARIMASGETSQVEEEVTYPDGRSSIWLSTKAPLRDKDGAVIGLIGSSVDISELKSAEAKLRELNDTLERRVAEEVAERTKAEDALRQAQKMEAVGQLTGGIAHDFNNLLTVVVGNIDMGLRALEATKGDPRIRRALTNAQKGAERAGALTQRLLAFSRRQPLAPKPLDVDKLVLGMSDMLNRALGEQVRLEIVTSPGLWRVEADPNQLESAILNLAVNARDAMPEGGSLTVETANARLDEEYVANQAEVAPGNYVMIAVSDTGEGMSKETMARVFEPFFTTKEVGKGTGLGLSMVYGFTKQSGGHIKVYSEEGRGTTIRIYLPRLLSNAESPPDLQPWGGVETSAQSETLLVVEDDDDVRAYTVDCLRDLGYRVLEAHDGPSALRLLEREPEPIDLLFTDVVMPGISGRELADAAREMQPGLRVLYTSGYTRNAIVHGGRLDEGVEMIPKPFASAALARKVRDMLDAGRTRRVLVVEGEPTVRALATEILLNAGYAVDEAVNAAEALGRVRAAQGHYDFVALDLHLPDKAGVELAAEIRANHLDLPLLLIAAEHVGEVARRFADDRCASVLSKPFNAARLVSALNDLGVRCRSRSSPS